jgi:hypothetical protein
MSTIPTPLLKDRTYASVGVTELFHGGTSYIQRAKVGILNTDEAVFDELTVTNLVVNGTVAGAAAEPVDLGLSPSQLVATNASSAPVSFPYGGSAGEIAIRDGTGAISFTKWTTPETAQTQLSLATGASTTLNVDINATADSVLTFRDVGADANVVTYSSGQTTKNVMPSGDNNIYLRSTGGLAGVRMQTDDVGAGSILSYDLGANGTDQAKITTAVDSKSFSINSAASAPRLEILPTGDGTSNITMHGDIRPLTTAEWGLSNGNENSFTRLYLNTISQSSANFTNPVASSEYITRITLNSGASDSIAAQAFKDCTFTNPRITATSKFLITLQFANGTLNTATVGMPYMFVKSTTPGSCVLRTCNISPTGGNTLSVSVAFAVVILP